jgi:hypothetical protein
MAPAMTRALSVRHIGWKLLGTGVALLGLGVVLWAGAEHDVTAWAEITGGAD